MINPGDVVRLNSGGPKMTIAKVDVEGKSGSMLCVWFPALDVKPETAYFLANSLTVLGSEED